MTTSRAAAPPPAGPGHARSLRVTGAALVVVLAAVAAVLVSRPRSGLAQSVGDLAILGAALLALAGCSRAARRGGPSGRAWTMLTVAMGIWSAGHLVWTAYGLTRAHVYPFPSLADVGYLGYAVPAALGLLLFPRSSVRHGSRLRELLDACVIAGAVLFVSWATVLGPLYQASGTGLTRLAALGFPVADVAVVSVVLALGTRVPPGQRQTWLLLGGGLVLLACTDSVYASLTLQGSSGTTGTPLALGWIGAFLLVGAASQVPAREAECAGVRHFSVAQELLPSLPLLGAVVVAAAHRFDSRDVFLVANGVLLLLLAAAQVVVVAVEKVHLANGLEATVASRTAELVSADARFRALVQSSDDAIFSKTPDGVITSWNTAAQRLLGYSEEEMIGARVELIVPDGRREEELEGRQLAASGATFRRDYETERRRKDGTLVPVALTVSPIYDGAAIPGVSVIARDITGVKARERELAAARTAALEASRSKSDFLATMSHEIRTPMNAVIGMTGLLLDTELDTRQREFTETVRDSGEALLAVINDILDFSKIESGELELDSHPFELRDCVDGALALVAFSAGGKDLELVATLDESCPEMVAGDLTRFRQVIVNLLANAVKFTARGEVVVSVSASPPTGQAEGPVRLTVAVTDTGIGIPADRMHRLFQAFSQVDSSTTRTHGGTGLGLVISRRLAQAMGGDLEVSSTVGVGSTFTFTAVLTGAPERRSTAAPRADALAGRSALVVDDNATNRRMLGLLLEGWGMTCTQADTPASALELLAAGAPGVDVAVLDMQMPDMDGQQLATAIRELPTGQDLPLVLLTSLQWHPVPDTSLFAATLTKPAKASVLREKLLTALAPADATLHALETAGGQRTGDGPGLDHPGARRAVQAASLRVLLAEDNPVNQRVAQLILAKLGYRVDTVSNGLEAVAAVRRATYDVVLMDVQMPQMDGLDATRAIRSELPADRQPRIVAMTASVLVEDRVACAEAGMDDYLSKPVRAQELSDALTQAGPQATGEGARPGPGAPTTGADPREDPESAVRARLADLAGPDLDDDRDFFAQMLRSFIASGPGLLDELRDASRREDARDVEQRAHSLKGSAANLGGAGLARLLEHVELQGRLGRSTDLAVHHDRLREELAAFNDALAAVAGELEHDPRSPAADRGARGER